MANQTQALSNIDASVLNQIPNVLLIVGMVAIYQSGFEAAFTLGMVVLGLGVIAKLALLVMSRTPVLKIFEQSTVIGMFIGILWMLQSWDIKLYEYGFVVLGICTLAFIVIIHIPVPEDAE